MEIVRYLDSKHSRISVWRGNEGFRTNRLAPFSFRLYGTVLVMRQVL